MYSRNRISTAFTYSTFTMQIERMLIVDQRVLPCYCCCHRLYLRSVSTILTSRPCNQAWGLVHQQQQPMFSPLHVFPINSLWRGVDLLERMENSYCEQTKMVSQQRLLLNVTRTLGLRKRMTRVVGWVSWATINIVIRMRGSG